MSIYIYVGLWHCNSQYVTRSLKKTESSENNKLKKKNTQKPKAKHEFVKMFYNVELIDDETAQPGFATPNTIITTDHKKPLELTQLKAYYMLTTYQGDCCSVWSGASNLIGNLEAGRGFIYTKTTSTSLIFQVQLQGGLVHSNCPPQLPAWAKGPRCPVGLTPKPSLPLLYCQSPACTKASFYLGAGGKARELIKQFLKTKDLDIWLALILLLLSTRLKTNPRPTERLS